ncbi:MAG TPA: DUF4340 domain-containing protein [Polyangiaceae bacterium]|nr:DUF4340 domain-containing protein [Polyangiaceae bacterium]
MASTDTKLYAALGVLAILGGALYMTNQKEKAEAESYSLSGRQAELPKLEVKDEDVSKINRITIRKPKKDDAEAVEIVLVKDGDQWKLEKPVTAPANQANVKSMLDNLKSLKVTELIDPSKAAYDKYEVSDEKALHVVFAKDNGVVLDAHFGEHGGRGQMTRLAGKEGVYSVKGYSGYLYDRDVKGFRDMQLFKFEEADVTAVTINNEHGAYEFAKTGEDWTAKYKRAPLQNFDPAKIKDMIRAYRSLNADNFAEPSKTKEDAGLDKPVATVVFGMKDGGKKEIAVGANAEGASRWVTVSGKDEIFSISSWAGDWAIAEPKKFQKAEKKDDSVASKN